MRLVLVRVSVDDCPPWRWSGRVAPQKAGLLGLWQEGGRRLDNWSRALLVRTILLGVIRTDW